MSLHKMERNDNMSFAASGLSVTEDQESSGAEQVPTSATENPENPEETSEGLWKSYDMIYVATMNYCKAQTKGKLKIKISICQHFIYIKTEIMLNIFQLIDQD